MKYHFRNDYSEIGHPEILKEMIEHAYTKNIGYGFDEQTNKLEKLVCEKVGQDIKVILVAGGTLTNLTVISKILAPYEAVISVDSGHINVHEGGAIEGTGHKVLVTSDTDGKITSAGIKEVVRLHTDTNMVLPKLVYFSNSTEVGTVYTKEELKDIYKTCQELGLYVFIDGARLAQGMQATNVTLKDICEYSDIFYVGGTKIGLPYGEMIVVKNKDIYKNFHYHLKNRGAMLAKTFVLSIMFCRLLKDDFYLELARNANETCQIVKQGLIGLGVEVCYPNPTNQLFVKFNKKVIEKLRPICSYEVWMDFEDSQIIRLVTSFATEKEKCFEFLKEVKNILEETK